MDELKKQEKGFCEKKKPGKGLVKYKPGKVNPVVSPLRLDW